MLRGEARAEDGRVGAAEVGGARDGSRAGVEGEARLLAPPPSLAPRLAPQRRVRAVVRHDLRGGRGERGWERGGEKSSGAPHVERQQEGALGRGLHRAARVHLDADDAQVRVRRRVDRVDDGGELLQDLQLRGRGVAGAGASGSYEDRRRRRRSSSWCRSGKRGSNSRGGDGGGYGGSGRSSATPRCCYLDGRWGQWHRRPGGQRREGGDGGRQAPTQRGHRACKGRRPPRVRPSSGGGSGAVSSRSRSDDVE